MRTILGLKRKNFPGFTLPPGDLIKRGGGGLGLQAINYVQ